MAIEIKLSKQWWEDANAVSNHIYDRQRWKKPYKCMKQIVEQMTGDDTGNRPFPYIITYHRIDPNDLMKLLIRWLAMYHIFTQIYILKVLPTLIHTFTSQIIAKSEAQLTGIICGDLWKDKRRRINTLCVTVLLEIWIKTKNPFTSGSFEWFFTSSYKAPIVRENALDFITKCTYVKGELQRKQLNNLLEYKRQRWHNDFGDNLRSSTLNGKHQSDRTAGCVCVYTMIQNGVSNEHIAGLWEDIKATKRMKKSIDFAKKVYMDKENMLNGDKLIYGFVRRMMDISTMPHDILTLLINWYSDFHFTLNRLNDFQQQCDD
eukprot:164301_1